MKRITKRQTLSLLRKAQRFQIEDGGKHRIHISMYETNGVINFFTWGFVGENYEKVVSCDCFCWREFEKNRSEIESFFEIIRNN